MLAVAVAGRPQPPGPQFGDPDPILKPFANVLCPNQQMVTRTDFLIRPTRVLTCLATKYSSSPAGWGFGRHPGHPYQTPIRGPQCGHCFSVCCPFGHCFW